MRDERVVCTPLTPDPISLLDPKNPAGPSEREGGRKSCWKMETIHETWEDICIGAPLLSPPVLSRPLRSFLDGPKRVLCGRLIEGCEQ
ncbi:uncharacterized [Tachysurus ichikawai]